jgi:hypothetical protein
MGTALTGLEIKDTYESLIKVGDNGPLDGTLQRLSDGLGNDLPFTCIYYCALTNFGAGAVTSNTAFGATALDSNTTGFRKTFAIGLPSVEFKHNG